MEKFNYSGPVLKNIPGTIKVNDNPRTFKPGELVFIPDEEYHDQIRDAGIEPLEGLFTNIPGVTIEKM